MPPESTGEGSGLNIFSYCGDRVFMKISTKGRYAVRVMLDLALHGGGEYIKVKEIAARQGLSAGKHRRV